LSQGLPVERMNRGGDESNRAARGFWATVRHRYHATQVTWECKNYDELKSDDFQQAVYYMSKAIGYVVIVVFRGDVKKHYFDHIKRIASETNGIILLLTENDLLTFIQEARERNTKEESIQGIFDRTIRAIL
jgi:hypothetical protein